MLKGKLKDQSSAKDSTLVQAVLEGDTNAYSILVQRYQMQIKAALRVRLYSNAETEDLAQEAFMVAFHKLDTFDQSASFVAWVRGIAIKLLKNHLRKIQPIQPSEQTELEELLQQQLDESFAHNSENDTLLALQHCFEKLNDKSRQLMAEHYQHGFTLVELTNKYKTQHSAMTMRMFRIRQKLRECIEKSLQRFQNGR